MKCPICNDVRMREVEKNGIHIDVCPDCKGVWLDRGELDKLMQGVREVRQEYNEWHHTKPSEHHGNEYKHPKYKKKNSVLDVLSDLF